MQSIITSINISKPLSKQKKPDYVCEPGDPRVKKYGWQRSKFRGYLSIDPDDEETIYISAIESIKKGNGDFSRLIRNLHKKGFVIKVPAPFPKMEAICKHLGFINVPELWPEMGETIDCYVLSPNASSAPVKKGD
jgi:hypothetical protein